MSEDKNKPKEDGVNNPEVPPTDPSGGGDTTPKSEDPNTEHKPELVPKSRLNETLERAKKAEAKAEKLEKEKADAETKKLEEEGEYKKLFEDEKLAREESDKKVQQAKIKAAFSSQAMKANVVDVDDAYKLADLSQVQVNEDGGIEGLDGIVDKLIESKPYLVQKGSAPVGSPTNPSPDGQEDKSGSKISKTFTRSQIEAMGTDEYAENEKAIFQAQADGTIEDV